MITAYEDEEKKRLENQLKDYEKQIERETQNERTKHQRNVEQVNKFNDFYLPYHTSDHG